MIHDTLITYFISQKLRRYIPLNNQEKTESFNIESYCLGDLYHYLDETLKNDSLPWAAYTSCFNKPKQVIYDGIQKHITSSEKNQIKIIDRASDYYPDMLKHIHAAPHILNVKGNYRGLNSIKPISIIGSRRCSSSHLEDSYKASSTLSHLGFSIISGGALGCDSYAHKGALSNQNHYFPTASILAGGLSHLYPKTNYFLFEKIVDKGGALISESLHDYQMRPRDFPIRNRIIAGMSEHLVVVNAKKRSGSYITCQQALDEGREVVIYSSSNSWGNSAGSLDLIKSGATHLSSNAEILERFL